MDRWSTTIACGLVLGDTLRKTVSRSGTCCFALPRIVRHLVNRGEHKVIDVPATRFELAQRHSGPGLHVALHHGAAIVNELAVLWHRLTDEERSDALGTNRLSCYFVFQQFPRHFSPIRSAGARAYEVGHALNAALRLSSFQVSCHRRTTRAYAP